MIKKYSILIIIIYLPLLNAQDAHYWTNQYGTDAQLLGGLVVGSVNDLSSTFYNPGSTQTRPTPGIFAYRFMSDSLQKNHFAFSVVIRRNFDYEFENVFLLQGEIADIRPGIENYTGEFYRRNSLNETWVGFSWSRKLSDNTGLGITQYVTVRSQHARTQNITQVLGEFDTGNSIVYINRWNYRHARLLWKLGYIYNSNKFSYGVTLTTPSISILGNASSFSIYKFKLTLGLSLGFGASDEENIVGFETNYQEDKVQPIVEN